MKLELNKINPKQLNKIKIIHKLFNKPISTLHIL